MRLLSLALLKTALGENLDAIPFPKDQSSDHVFPARPQRSPNMPFGHLRPLGTQRKPEGQVTEFDAKLMNSYTLYESMKAGPCVAKNLITLESGVASWDDVALEEHGNIFIEFAQKLPGAKQKMGMKTIDDLIGHYHGHDLHIDSTLPKELEHHVNLPKALMCGPFKNEVVDRRLWRSSGKLVEPLKKSPFDQMFCTLHGRSDWIIYDSRDNKHLGGRKQMPDGSTVFDVDVDLVNMYNAPGLKQSRWRWTTTKNRACLFVPANTAYQVRHYSTTNVLSMQWKPFQATMASFPVDECDNAATTADSGHGVWVLENGSLAIHEDYLSDWSRLRDLLLIYSDNKYSLTKATWRWLVSRAANTYGDPEVTWNYFTGFDDNAEDVNVTEIVQESLKVAITYQLTNPDQEKHHYRDEL